MNEEASRTQIIPPEFDQGLHITSAVRQRVTVPRGPFLEWAARTPLEKVLLGTSFIAAIVRTEPIKGQYPDPGSIRRVILADDSSALEVIHENCDDKFAYQVWGFSAAPFIKYARCAFYYTDDGDGCLIDWVYEFRPTSILFSPIVYMFAKLIFRGFMKKSIETIRALAEVNYRES